MKIFSLLQLKYSNFSLAVQNYLSKLLSKYNISYGNNTIFGQLINVLNGVVQNIMLYIEDSLVEQNKYTAQRKKSIYGLASLTGYQPHLGKAANVQLRLSYMPNNESNWHILINNHESVTCSQNGLSYNLILPQETILMTPDKNQINNICAIQGKFETQNFVSIGGKYYTQNFNFLGNLDVDYITVKINDEKWDYIESLYDMECDGKQWTFKISPIGGIDLIFGNDIHGRSLKDGDIIEVTYLLHDGEFGNLDINQETYFVFNDLLKNIIGEEVDGNSIFTLTFATNDAVTAGSNSESIDQVKQMIGFNSRSLVLASPENYKNFLSKFSFCGYNRTWSEPGSMVISSMIIKNYKSYLTNNKTYFDLKESDFILTEMQKKSITNCLEKTGSQLAGMTYNIIDPEICKYAMYIYIKPKSLTYDKTHLDLQIRNLVGDFFSNLHSDIFIPKSDIIQLLKNNISEIDGISLYILSEKNEKARQTGVYETYSGNNLNQIKETVYLYPGENPNLGLDDHGNIYLQSDGQFPVLMGGWDYLNNEGDEVTITDPLIITYTND